MMKRNKIKTCIFTSSRADYGILSGLMNEVKKRDDFTLQIIASGSHLSHRHGYTLTEIESDGFKVDKKIDILLSSDSPSGTAKASALGIIGFSDALNELKSDIVLILGDRFEALSMAIAAVIQNVPIAHIHGGEITIGSMDEIFRHSITKMSRLHFVSTDEYRRRVIQLGENPEFVYNTGAPGVENIKKIKLLSKNQLEKLIGFKFGLKNILVCFHPQTLSSSERPEKISELLSALETLDEYKIIFTMPNADCGGEEIRSAIKKFTAKNSKRSIAFDSLGKKLYFSFLNTVDAVVGNSSSGIIEAPSFKTATINIGSRQQGRLRSSSVIDCAAHSNEIIKAFNELYSIKFQKMLSRIKNIYEKKDTARNIIEIIKKMIIKQKLKTEKSFYDIDSLISKNNLFPF